MLIPTILCLAIQVSAPETRTETWPGGEPKVEAQGHQDSAGRWILHGAYESWHENGQRHEKGAYEQGHRTGTWTIRDEEGKVREKGDYLRGLRDGRWKLYIVDRKGKRKSIGEDYRYWRHENPTSGLLVEGSTIGEYRAGEARVHRADGSLMLTVGEQGRQGQYFTPGFPERPFWRWKDDGRGVHVEGEWAGDPLEPAQVPSPATPDALAGFLHARVVGMIDGSLPLEQTAEALKARLLTGPGASLTGVAAIRAWLMFHELATVSPDAWSWHLHPELLQLGTEGLPPFPVLGPTTPFAGRLGHSPRRLQGGFIIPKPKDAARRAEASEDALLRGLDYLLTLQAEDGSFRSSADDPHVLAKTATVTLAILGNAQSPRIGQHRVGLQKALLWMMAATREAGGQLHLQREQGVYQHALAVRAMAEAAYLTQHPGLRISWRQADRALLELQLADGGFPAEAGGDREDLATTMEALMALTSAQELIAPSKEEAKQTTRWAHASLDRGKGPIRNDGPEGIAPSKADTLTARLAFLYPFVGANTRDMKVFHDWLEEVRPRGQRLFDRDPMLLNYAMHTAYQIGGGPFVPWREKLVPEIVESQREDGSWPTGKRKADPILDTAHYVMTLEAEYRYARNL